MQNFHEDIDTRITFHQLQNDGTQIECNVHTKKGKLFFDRQGELYEPDLLPTIYLVDNRTNCHGLVLEAGNITVKYIGAIRGPGIVIADMSSVLKYSELNGRCLAILRLGGTKVDEDLSVEVISSSTESIEGPTVTYPPPTDPPLTLPPTTATTATTKPSSPSSSPTITYPSLPPLPTGTTEGNENR